MYFVIVFVFCWVLFLWKGDKKRIKELYGAVIYTSFLGLFSDLIMVHYQLWSYNGLPYPLYSIPLALDFSIYPVVAFLFTQTLPDTWRQIGTRAFLWTLPSIFFEYVTIKMGNMEHHQWWNLWWSFGADLVIYMSIAMVYRTYRTSLVGNY